MGRQGSAIACRGKRINNEKTSHCHRPALALIVLQLKGATCWLLAIAGLAPASVDEISCRGSARAHAAQAFAGNAARSLSSPFAKPWHTGQAHRAEKRMYPGAPGRLWEGQLAQLVDHQGA